jgi:hypothetical protein
MSQMQLAKLFYANPQVPTVLNGVILPHHTPVDKVD